MPLKQRITREMILERAFEMYCREGMDVINARSVAKALNCSTQPIFSYYSGMGDLKETLMLKAKALLADALKAQGEGAAAAAYCSALACFAVQQPKLYLHLSMTDDALFPFADEQERAALIDTQAQQTGLTSEQAADVLAQLILYATGLAAACATGKNAYSEDEIGALIVRVHDALVKAA